MTFSAASGRSPSLFSRKTEKLVVVGLFAVLSNTLEGAMNARTAAVGVPGPGAAWGRIGRHRQHGGARVLTSDSAVLRWAPAGWGSPGGHLCVVAWSSGCCAACHPCLLAQQLAVQCTASCARKPGCGRMREFMQRCSVEADVGPSASAKKISGAGGGAAE